MNYLQDYSKLRKGRIYKDIIVYTVEFEKVYQTTPHRDNDKYTRKPVIDEYVTSFKSIKAVADFYNLNADYLSKAMKKHNEKRPNELFIFKKHFKNYIKPFYFTIVIDSFTLDDLL